MTLNLSSCDYAKLAEAIFCTLENSFSNIQEYEPKLISNFVYYLPKYINDYNFSKKIIIKSGGIFIHANPLITCKSFPDKSPKSVEIGDLLLIRTLVINKKPQERRALMLQAKKTKNIPTTPDNKNQWHIYEKWPMFTYAKRSGTLTGQVRHIQEPDMYDAAKYLLIGTNHNAQPVFIPYCCLFPWKPYLPAIHNLYTAHPTMTNISRYRSFSAELFQFLIGNAGKIFQKPEVNDIGWNKVINDLVTMTRHLTTSYIKPPTNTRGQGSFFMTNYDSSESYMALNTDGYEGNNGLPPGLEEIDDSDGGGISIIEFIVEQQD